MKKIDKLISEVEKMLKEAEKNADICSSVEFDSGFYTGKSEGLEEVLELLNKIK